MISNKEETTRFCMVSSGAERGIRTLDTVPRIHDFQSCALDQAQPSLHGDLHLCYLTTNYPKKQDIFSAAENYFEKPLAFLRKPCIIFSVRGALAQLVARNVRNVEVRSSNLLCSTSKGHPTWVSFLHVLLAF